jgi:flagellar P-ring protein precursor FlgI
MMTSIFRVLAMGVAACLLGQPSAEAARIKDVARVYGVRDNLLVGYGLVTGLTRTGDTIQNRASILALVNRLQGMGITVAPNQVWARNVAVVMVTAKLPPYARSGHKLDVEVSSTGDASSLAGGLLQLTLLEGPDGEVYATAQGPLVVGGFIAQQGGTSARKNFPNVGRVPQGGIVEKSNPNKLELTSLSTIEWIIDEPDFTTAIRVADAINDTFDEDLAQAMDGGTVAVSVPPRYAGRQVELVSVVELVDVEVDAPARVVINERTGTVVMGDDVRIEPVAVAHGGLNIQVQRDTDISQPGALANRGRTVVNRESQVSIEESGGELVQVQGTTIRDLVNALNSLGVKPRDLIQILLTIKAAGALHAELEVL